MKFKRILAGICALTIIAALSACTTETTDSESSEVESSAADQKKKVLNHLRNHLRSLLKRRQRQPNLRLRLTLHL